MPKGEKWQNRLRLCTISARNSPEAITKKKISQPSLFALEEVVFLEALEKHEKDNKITIPSRYPDKRRWLPVGESGSWGTERSSNTKESNSQNPVKNNVKGRTRHHKKREKQLIIRLLQQWKLFISHLDPIKNVIPAEQHFM